MTLILKAFCLSALYGFTEIFPISYSAASLLLGHIFHTSLGDSHYAAAREAGLLAAGTVYYAKEIWQMVRESPIFLRLPFLRGREAILLGYPNALILSLVMVSMIPAAVVSFTFRDMAESFSRFPISAGVILVVLAILIYRTRTPQSEQRMIYEMNHRDSYIIGLAQGFSVLPGIALPAITALTGIFLGINSKEAIRFSLFCTIPWLLIKLIQKRLMGELFHLQMFPAMAGFLGAALSGYAALYFVEKLAEKSNYYKTAPFCFGFGVFCLFFFYLRMLGL